jgi:hypothetical protein
MKMAATAGSRGAVATAGSGGAAATGFWSWRQQGLKVGGGGGEGWRWRRQGLKVGDGGGVASVWRCRESWIVFLSLNEPSQQLASWARAFHTTSYLGSSMNWKNVP